MKSKRNWLTQVPGVVTSVTATVTALVGLYAVLVQNDIIPNIFASRQKEAQQEQTEVEKDSTDDSSNWKNGERVLAQWKDDQYWYPATVEEVDSSPHRYSVKFGDGTTAWIVGAQMLPEDIKVGDRISADRDGDGNHYWGKVTERDGDKIHLSYEDGTEGDTTIDVVRVVRPRTE